MRQLVYASLLLIIMLRATWDERKICSTIQKSQNIMNMILASYVHVTFDIQIKIPQQKHFFFNLTQY